MKVTVEGEVFEFDSKRLLNTEAIAIQKSTGYKPEEWVVAMQTGDPMAITALVWLMYRRDGRDVSFDQTEFDMGSIKVDAGEDAVPPTRGRRTPKTA